VNRTVALPLLQQGHKNRPQVREAGKRKTDEKEVGEEQEENKQGENV
jgi:hypothetical protein